MPRNNARLLIDGRVVRCFLFQRISRLSPHPVLWQVEGFTVDHALTRLCEVEAHIARGDWEMIAELDAEHDVGAMGRKLPLLTHNPREDAIAANVRLAFLSRSASRLKH